MEFEEEIEDEEDDENNSELQSKVSTQRDDDTRSLMSDYKLGIDQDGIQSQHHQLEKSKKLLKIEKYGRAHEGPRKRKRKGKKQVSILSKHFCSLCRVEHIPSNTASNAPASTAGSSKNNNSNEKSSCSFKLFLKNPPSTTTTLPLNTLGKDHDPLLGNTNESIEAKKSRELISKIIMSAKKNIISRIEIKLPPPPPLPSSSSSQQQQQQQQSQQKQSKQSKQTQQQQQQQQQQKKNVTSNPADANVNSNNPKKQASQQKNGSNQQSQQQSVKHSQRQSASNNHRQHHKGQSHNHHHHPNNYNNRIQNQIYQQPMYYGQMPQTQSYSQQNMYYQQQGFTPNSQPYSSYSNQGVPGQANNYYQQQSYPSGGIQSSSLSQQFVQQTNAFNPQYSIPAQQQQQQQQSQPFSLTDPTWETDGIFGITLHSDALGGLFDYVDSGDSEALEILVHDLAQMLPNPYEITSTSSVNPVDDDSYSYAGGSNLLGNIYADIFSDDRSSYVSGGGGMTGFGDELNDFESNVDDGGDDDVESLSSSQFYQKSIFGGSNSVASGSRSKIAMNSSNANFTIASTQQQQQQQGLRKATSNPSIHQSIPPQNSVTTPLMLAIPQRKAPKHIPYLFDIYHKYDKDRDERVAMAVDLAESERARRLAQAGVEAWNEQLERARRIEWAITAIEAEQTKKMQANNNPVLPLSPKQPSKAATEIMEKGKRLAIELEEQERSRRTSEYSVDNVFALYHPSDSTLTRHQSSGGNSNVSNLDNLNIMSPVKSNASRSRASIDLPRRMSYESSQSEYLSNPILSPTFSKRSNDNESPPSFNEDYEVICPYSMLGCDFVCLRTELPSHLEQCRFRAKATDKISDSNPTTFADLYNPLEYVVMCPYGVVGCPYSCRRVDLPEHLRRCPYRAELHENPSSNSLSNVPGHGRRGSLVGIDINLANAAANAAAAAVGTSSTTSNNNSAVSLPSYEVVCPNSVLGCDFICLRSDLNQHLGVCRFRPISRQEEEIERENNKAIVIAAAEAERNRRVGDNMHADLYGHQRLHLFGDILAAGKKSPNNNNNGIMSPSKPSTPPQVQQTPQPVNNRDNEQLRLLLRRRRTEWVLKAAEIERIRQSCEEFAIRKRTESMSDLASSGNGNNNSNEHTFSPRLKSLSPKPGFEHHPESVTPLHLAPISMAERSVSASDSNSRSSLKQSSRRGFRKYPSEENDSLGSLLTQSSMERVSLRSHESNVKKHLFSPPHQNISMESPPSSPRVRKSPVTTQIIQNPLSPSSLSSVSISNGNSNNNSNNNNVSHMIPKPTAAVAAIAPPSLSSSVAAAPVVSNSPSKFNSSIEIFGARVQRKPAYAPPDITKRTQASILHEHIEQQTTTLYQTLHGELENFARYCAVEIITSQASRRAILQKVRDTVRIAWSKSQDANLAGNIPEVDMYGSFATQLAVPNVSDLDLVVLMVPNKPKDPSVTPASSVTNSPNIGPKKVSNDISAAVSSAIPPASIGHTEESGDHFIAPALRDRIRAYSAAVHSVLVPQLYHKPQSKTAKDASVTQQTALNDVKPSPATPTVSSLNQSTSSTQSPTAASSKSTESLVDAKRKSLTANIIHTKPFFHESPSQALLWNVQSQSTQHWRTQLGEERAQSAILCNLLGQELKGADWVENVKVIDTAQVPLIKLTTNLESLHISIERSKSSSSASSSSASSVLNNISPEKDTTTSNEKEANNDQRLISIDITFAFPSHAGMATVEFVQALRRRFPPLTPITLAIKAFLASMNLNDPFSGGLGSYALVLMVAASLIRSRERWGKKSIGAMMLQQKRLIPPWKKTDEQYGHLLVDFLELYGRDFDPKSDAVVFNIHSTDDIFSSSGIDSGITSSIGGIASTLGNYPGGMPLGGGRRPPLLSIAPREHSCVAVVQSMIVSAAAANAETKGNGLIHPSTSPPPVPSTVDDALLVIDDPVRPGNNIGRTCFAFPLIQRAFADALAALLSHIVRCKAINDTRGLGGRSPTPLIERILKAKIE